MARQWCEQVHIHIFTRGARNEIAHISSCRYRPVRKVWMMFWMRQIRGNCDMIWWPGTATMPISIFTTSFSLSFLFLCILFLLFFIHSFFVRFMYTRMEWWFLQNGHNGIHYSGVDHGEKERWWIRRTNTIGILYRRMENMEGHGIYGIHKCNAYNKRRLQGVTDIWQSAMPKKILMDLG